MAETKDANKIRKLLRLATSANEHEAKRAAEQAKRLMTKNGLTEADFEPEVTEVADEKRDSHRSKLAHGIATSLRCKTFTNKQNQIAFRGLPTHVGKAKTLYRQLETEVSRHSEIGTNDPGRHVWRLCYWTGFVETVATRLAGATPTAPPPAWTEQLIKRASTPVEMSSMRQETTLAILDFASYFIPEDVGVAISRLCTDAYESGRRLGCSVSIEYKEPTT
ncbi:MAG TPA: DUF2786 domain-containing protein [Gemmatimonadaceae bacterium]|nr:DUF2786 domain-containing protein [Gemmatimonadaceae bacterium]